MFKIFRKKKEESKNLTDVIFKKTKKKLGEDYGFIVSTTSPYKDENPDGMMRATSKKGFEVWKKIKDNYETTNIVPVSCENSVEKIVEFLNK